MRKIILFIIYSLCLLFVYYVGFQDAHALYQHELFSNAIENNDNDFFLKFNSAYNENYIYYNNTLASKMYVYEVYNNDDYYTFLINDLDETKLEEIVKFVITGNDGNKEIELQASDYISSNMYYIMILASELTDDIGNKVTNFTFLDNNDIELFNYNTNIDLLEFDTDNFADGYTVDEMLELYTFEDVSSIYLSLLKFSLIYGALTAIYLVSKYFIDKRNM